MFFKLALRNVRRSFRDYGVYLLTLTFGVCLFYTFNSLEGQGAMVYLAQNGSPMVEVIQACISIFSVFVAVVLACLILYANRFLLRRRTAAAGRPTSGRDTSASTPRYPAERPSPPPGL